MPVGQIAEGEGAHGHAAQRGHVVAHGREHAPHLVVAPLVNGELRQAFTAHRQLRREQRVALPLQHQGARGKARGLVATEGRGEFHLVHLGHV